MALPRPYVQVEVNGRVPPGVFLSMHVDQNPGAHEMVTVRYESIYGFRPMLNTQRMYRSGQPVIAQWGRAPFAVDTYYGYIHDAQVDHRQGRVPVVRLRSIGTTYPMKTGGTNVFHDVSASYVARWFARKHHLQAVVDKHPKVWSTLAQGGRTDWGFLAYVASLVGYDLYADKVRLYFVDPRKHGDRYAPVLRLGHELLSFAPTISESMPDSAITTQEASGVDPRTGAVISASSSPLVSWSREELVYNDPDCPPVGSALIPTFTSIVPNVSADSYADLTQAVDDVGRSSRWLVTARMSIVGDVRVRPGKRVHTEGLEPQYNGMWTVRDVKHALTRSKGHNFYTTYFTAARDSLWTTTSLPADWAPQSPDSNNRIFYADGRWQSIVSSDVVAV